MECKEFKCVRKPLKDLKEGDTVYIITYDKTGRKLAIKDKVTKISNIEVIENIEDIDAVEISITSIENINYKYKFKIASKCEAVAFRFSSRSQVHFFVTTCFKHFFEEAKLADNDIFNFESNEVLVKVL